MGRGGVASVAPHNPAQNIQVLLSRLPGSGIVLSSKFIGSPGIPVVTRQISLPRRAKPLEIFGRPLNDVLFSREFRESPYFLTYAIVERYADIRRAMRAPHGPGLIGDVDTLIAATALERNLTVVTLDQDFTRVPGLHVQLLERPRSNR